MKLGEALTWGRREGSARDHPPEAADDADLLLGLNGLKTTGRV
jgi:hypothetical protein